MKALLQYLRWLYRHAKGVRGALVGNILLGLLSVGLNLLFIWISKRLIDLATGDFLLGKGHLGRWAGSLAAGGLSSRREGLIFFAVLMLAVIALRLAVNALNTRLENVTSARMNFMIRRRLFSDLLQAQWQGKEKMHSGDTLNRLFSDVSAVTNVICGDFPAFITTLFQLVAAFFFLSTMDVRLALLMLIVTPVFLAFSKIFFRRMRAMTRDIRETESKVQSHIQESIQHKTVIQSLERNGLVEDQLDEMQQDEYGQVLRRTRFSIFSRLIVSGTFQAGYAMAFLWGVFGIFRGTTTFGMMTAFLQLVSQIQNPSLRLTRQIPGFVYATASIDRLMELEGAEKEEAGEPVLLPGIAGIRITDLSFRYPDGVENVFTAFSHDFRPGTRTAVVGETGVGKSTLIRLMLSLLRPDSGRIELYSDRHDPVPATAATRPNLVYVPQGNTLFSGSIRDNLLMGDPQADDQRLWEVLETAAADFVRDLPDGLDTLCGERGTGLSEGQAQRIAIARGLLRPGSILLLDEFSSSLDAQTEERLMQALVATAHDKTMIFITHREKIAQFCDAVLRIQT